MCYTVTSLRLTLRTVVFISVYVILRSSRALKKAWQPRAGPVNGNECDTFRMQTPEQTNNNGCRSFHGRSVKVNLSLPML
jgi:hypothetical protein